MRLFSALIYALNPREGEGVVDRNKTWFLLVLLGLTILAKATGTFHVGDLVFDGLLAAVAASLGYDSAHYRPAPEDNKGT